jgi:hypothetical protein
MIIANEPVRRGIALRARPPPRLTSVDDIR